MSSLLFYIDEAIEWGFAVTLPIMLAGYYLGRAWRPFIKQWLYSSYLIVFLYCIVTLTSRITAYIERLKYDETKIRNSPYSGGAYFALPANIDPFIYFYFALMVLALTLFCIRRIRQSFLWGFLVLAVITCFDNLFITFVSFYRDYHPSSWSIYVQTPFHINIYVINFIAFNILVAGVYFLRRMWMANMLKTA